MQKCTRNVARFVLYFFFLKKEKTAALLAAAVDPPPYGASGSLGTMCFIYVHPVSSPLPEEQR